MQVPILEDVREVFEHFIKANYQISKKINSKCGCVMRILANTVQFAEIKC